MTANYTRVPTRFAPETRFEVATAPAVPFRGGQETQLERLKQRLLEQLLNEKPDPELSESFQRAANEAASLAWMTSHPLLVFPALFEESAQRAEVQATRQARIRLRSRDLLAEVV